MSKFCTQCGTQLDEAARFCFNCGAPSAPPVRTAHQPQPPFIQQPPPQAQQSQYGQPVHAQAPQQPVYQPAPQVQQPAQLTEKQAVLYNAPAALNKPDQPWQVTVQGDSIIATWKWMDATFFAPHEVSQETRDYTFTVILSDKRTWREVDKTEETATGVKMSGSKISFGSSSNTFIGKQNKKSFQFGVGQNNQTGQTGLIGFKFNTTTVKESIRAYLTACGWKKAGLFG